MHQVSSVGLGIYTVIYGDFTVGVCTIELCTLARSVGLPKSLLQLY